MSAWVTAKQFYTGRTTGAGPLLAATATEPNLLRGVRIKCLTGTPTVRHILEVAGAGYPLVANEVVDNLPCQLLSQIEQVGAGTIAYIGT